MVDMHVLKEIETRAPANFNVKMNEMHMPKIKSTYSNEFLKSNSIYILILHITLYRLIDRFHRSLDHVGDGEHNDTDTVSIDSK